MKTIELTEQDFAKLQKLIQQHNELYEIENWKINDLDAFREICTETIQLLDIQSEPINNNPK